MIAGLASVLLIALVGCGGGDSSDSMMASANDSNIKRLGTLYSMFHGQNKLLGPKDEAEFKQFISEQDAARLQKGGIDIGNIDGLFTSERDQKPFRIRYGINTRLRGPSLPVVFEEEGKDGNRQVGYTGGAMKEVDEAEYDRLWEGGDDDQDSGGNRGG